GWARVGRGSARGGAGPRAGGGGAGARGGGPAPPPPRGGGRGPFAARPPSGGRRARPAPARERSPRTDAIDKLEGEPRTSSSRSGLVRRSQESRHVLRGKLHAQGCSKMIHAQTAEVFVEIAQRRRQRERLDPGGLRPVGQGRRRQVASWVVVAHDI